MLIRERVNIVSHQGTSPGGGLSVMWVTSRGHSHGCDAGPVHLTTFCRLDGPGLLVLAQDLRSDRAVSAGQAVDDLAGLDRWCRQCSCEGRSRDSATRPLVHEPWAGGRRRPRSRSAATSACSPSRQASRRLLCRRAARQAVPNAPRWTLVGFVSRHLTVARFAEALAVWDRQRQQVHCGFIHAVPRSDDVHLDAGDARLHDLDLHSDTLPVEERSRPPEGDGRVGQEGVSRVRSTSTSSPAASPDSLRRSLLRGRRRRPSRVPTVVR